MPTTVHIPPPLLARVDARAMALGVSRNRLITAAIEASLGPTADWAPELVRMMKEPLDQQAADALDESLAVVRSRRVNRRRGPKL